MIYEKYPDFNTLFFELNKKIIEDPSYVVNKISNCAFLPFLVIECDKGNCTIDLNELGYQKQKFQHLVLDYVNKDKLLKFFDKMKICTGTSLTYYFNESKKRNGSGAKNGPCLLSLVVTRSKKKEWEEVTVYFRSSELNRRLAADLILIDKIIKLLPYSKISKIRIVITKPYFSLLEGSGQLELFNINLEDMNGGSIVQDYLLPFITNVKTNPNITSKFKKRIRVLNLIRGTMPKHKPINVDELNIF